jgi:hypothetical protein
MPLATPPAPRLAKSSVYLRFPQPPHLPKLYRIPSFSLVFLSSPTVKFPYRLDNTYHIWDFREGIIVEMAGVQGLK